MQVKGFCLVRETFASGFIRKAARMVNFIALLARAHGLAEAAEFLDELRHSLGSPAVPTELRGRRSLWN